MNSEAPGFVASLGGSSDVDDAAATGGFAGAAAGVAAGLPNINPEPGAAAVVPLLDAGGDLVVSVFTSGSLEGSSLVELVTSSMKIFFNNNIL